MLVRPRLALLLAAFLLASCSAARLQELQLRQQADVDHEVRSRVHDGMPSADAVTALTDMGYGCTAGGGAAPRFDCARQRRLSWTLATCMQRVTFVERPADGVGIAELDVSTRACIGTP